MSHAGELWLTCLSLVTLQKLQEAIDGPKAAPIPGGDSIVAHTPHIWAHVTTTGPGHCISGFVVKPDLNHICLVAQSCPTLCDLRDCSLPGSFVHGILQARIQEWVAFPFSRASSQRRDRTQVCHIAGGFFTTWATREGRKSQTRLSNQAWANRITTNLASNTRHSFDLPLSFARTGKSPARISSDPGP